MAKATRYTKDMVDEYISKGYWTGETTAELWDRNAELFGNEEALVDSRKRLTWLGVKQRSDSMATNLLDMGFQRDELIFLLVPNCVESYIVRLACEKAGVLCFTALTGIREREIEYILKNYGIRGIVVQPQFRGFDYNRVIHGMMQELPDLKYVFSIGDTITENTISIEEICRKPVGDLKRLEEASFKMNEVAIVALTSGTTGMPKVAEHPVASRIALGDSYHKKLDLKKDDIILNVISAVAGLGAPVCYSSVRPGAKTVMMEIWDAKEALKVIEEERPTVLLTTPAQLAMLLQEHEFDTYDTSSFRAVYCGTSPLSYEIAKAGETKLKIPVLNAYGSFDGGGISSTSVYDKEETRLRTAGQPHYGNEVVIIDEQGNEVARGEEGELTFRGPCTCSGYYKDMERIKEMWGTLGKDGWFRTGDLAKLDEENNIILTGRKKEIIIRGGQNIYPSEIEGLLYMHPKVKHVAVVPMPDPIMGEKACAFVATKDNVAFTFDDMIAFLTEKKIAKYKLPERLEIRESLPLRDEQKVAKGSLIEEIKSILKTEGKV
jgi:non-ribosomal peptide synthetase component E (peptide arylation enzyme)